MLGKVYLPELLDAVEFAACLSAELAKLTEEQRKSAWIDIEDDVDGMVASLGYRR